MRSDTDQEWSWGRKLNAPLLRKATLWSVFLFLWSFQSSWADDGPGFGNLTYQSNELFQVISRIDDSNGVPSELVPTQYGDRHHGLGNMIMVNGYMVGVFAPDGGDGVGGWLAYNVSDPRNPTMVKRVYDASTEEIRESHSFGQSSIGSGHIVAIQSRKGVEFWDWDDVNNPVQLSKLVIPGVNSGDYSNVSWQLFWQAPYLYVGRGNAGITIINATDPANPSVVKTLANSNFGNFNIGPIFAMGNRMFVSGMQTTNGFSSLDLSDPENPTLITAVASAPFYYSSCFDGKTVALAVRNNGAKMVTYDASTANQLTLIDNNHGVDDMLYCSFQDNYVFQGSQTFITKVDISSVPYSTIGSGTLNVPNADHGQVLAFGNVAWVGNDHGTGSGFIVHQTAPDTTRPAVIASSPEPEATNQSLKTRVGVAFSDNLLMSSVNATTFKVRKLGTSTVLPGTYSVGFGIANFHPTSQLEANTTYVVETDGIKDTVGNSSATHTFRFSTGATIGHNITLSSNGPTETNQTVSFTGNAAPILGGTVEYSWNFGDGSSATPFSINGSETHSYSQPGHYTVTLAVRENGETSSRGMGQTIYNTPTTVKPNSSRTIIHNGQTVFNVNSDNDTVTAIDGSTYAKLWEQPVGDRPRTLAEAPNGNIWVVNELSNTISVLNASNGTLVTTHTLPRASRPHGIAFAPDGSNAYVTLQATGKLLKLDLNGSTVSEVTIGDSARGIAITSDSTKAYVTRFIAEANHAEVIAVNLLSMTPATITLQKDTTSIDSSAASRGVPNYLGSVSISPDGTRAWVPSNKANTDRGPFVSGNANETLNFENTIRAIVSQINTINDTELFSAQIDFDDRAQAKFVEFSSLGDYILVALEGSNRIRIHDAYNGQRVNEIVDTGFAPRGLVFNSDHSRLFVHNFMSRSVRVFNTSDLTADIAAVATTTTVANETLHARVLKGKQIFYNAADGRMSRDGYISCASCHTDGDSDGRLWDFTDRGEGVRNTISLLGRHGMGNGRVHWTANFDEIQDFENDIRYGFSGVGFITDGEFTAVENPLGSPKAGLSIELDNLAFYVGSLNEYPQSPFRNADGSLTTLAQQGQSVFQTKGCASCHSGVFYTDGQRHDVGTIQPSSGQGINAPLTNIGFDTPSLIGLWKNPPYLHNGQATTIEAVLDNSTHMGSTLTATEKSQLAAYLRQIEYSGPPIVVPDPPAEPQLHYVSDLTETSSTNGWGPIEKDTSNGENAAGDGNPMRIGSNTYTKGLGVHANSEVYYNLAGNYDRFYADIGVDEEVGGGTVVFEVHTDGTLRYQSGTINNAAAPQTIAVNVIGANQLLLKVTDAGDGVGADHANWADARLRTYVPPTNPGGGHRYVRLVATSEVNGNAWTSMAELNILSNSQPISQSGWTVVSVDSAETSSENGAGSNAIDGNTGTIWHTGYSSGTPTHPHQIIVDLGASHTINGFRYLPRQDGGINGTIAGYEFYVSTDGTNWGTAVATGTFANNTTQKEVIFSSTPTPVPATITSPTNGSTLDGASQTFTWSNDGLATSYQLRVGTSVGASDLHDSGVLASSVSSRTVSGLPTDGSTIYVRISTDISGTITNNDTTYTAANIGTNNYQYVKLEATSEVNGNAWTSMAELNILVGGTAISRSGWSATANSQETSGENGAVGNAIDGNNSTHWHTQWQGASPTHPHEIVVNLGAAHAVNGFRYLPRQDGGINGTIAGYKFYVSTDGVNWTEKASGTFANNTTEKTVTF